MPTAHDAINKNRPIRSRRKARLRVVGCEALGTRHAGIVAFTYRDGSKQEHVVEVVTFAEFDKLPEGLRPPPIRLITLPGLGYLFTHAVDSRLEREDIIDAMEQADHERQYPFGVDC